MKLWEAMELLDENPSLKFEYQDNRKKWLLYANVGGLTGLVFYQLDCWDNNGELMTGTAFGSLHGNLTTSNNWQLVREPVTWQEAIQAWSVGKRVKVSTIQRDYVFSQIEKMEVSPMMIQDGIWYVED